MNIGRAERFMGFLGIFAIALLGDPGERSPERELPAMTYYYAHHLPRGEPLAARQIWAAQPEIKP